MNNRQLQEAINKTMEFCLSTQGGYAQDRYREAASKCLDELLRLQVMRASMAVKPRITLEDIK